ncbi:molybdopterin synthase sulfur carrier subunit [Pedobacter ginsengisoli]|uniref:Molybdopterin synthase sulfur carrier subunit n=1 Tax=Pedobacter ginsengisoli TaxID=363852 RepID=A0A2D1U2T9_9SPHI|nr:MoaD/ThiS family protein [Pedobacter ginsengisoli]ATP55921.1 molybdopterin synthase sulfur carrier subunit [Pedobacter ginsengisoli]
MRIEVFAILKEYFSKEFEINERLKTIEELRAHLTIINPASSKILKICRFAVHDEFVADHYELTGTDNIVIIPPSSGG